MLLIIKPNKKLKLHQPIDLINIAGFIEELGSTVVDEFI